MLNHRWMFVMSLAALAVPAARADDRRLQWLDQLDVRHAVCAAEPMRRNGSVSGQPLRIAGRRFIRGVGGQARSELTVQLDGRAEYFVAQVGVDGAAEDRGRIEFIVMGDGRELWRSGEMRGRAPAKECRVELRGVNEATLIIDGSSDWGHGNWAEAHFAYQGEPPRINPVPGRGAVQTNLFPPSTPAGYAAAASGQETFFSTLARYRALAPRPGTWRVVDAPAAAGGVEQTVSADGWTRVIPKAPPVLAPGRELPLAIEQAVFGDLPDGRQKEVTAQVAAAVRDGHVAIQAANSVFGDPAPGAGKRLRVRYTLGGTPLEMTVGEGETLRLGRIPGKEAEGPVQVMLETTITSAADQDLVVPYRLPAGATMDVWLNDRPAPRNTDDRTFWLALRKGESRLRIRLATAQRDETWMDLRAGLSVDEQVRDLLRELRLDFPRLQPEPFVEYVSLWEQILERKAGYRGWQANLEEQVFRREALIWEGDGDPLAVVTRRVQALLEHLAAMDSAPNLAEESQGWKAFAARAAAVDPGDVPARYELFLQAREWRRRIMLRNPLLDFDRLVFVHRQHLPPHEGAGNHMCDQYFGFHALREGGLFILEDVWGGAPKARNVLAGSKVENGKFAGQALPPGGYLSPALSYDGKTLLFAYTEAEPTRYRWSEESTYAIFRVNVDGTGLRQLTSGPFNDIHPCFLPSGRIAFISERRGGYGRCHGRPVPTYTLHSMNPDGRDIVALSYHETNEWYPSVSNDGMLLYTRWDYTDRGHGQAHHPWITTPDGRDARPVHGNYGKKRGPLPNMEMQVRAIPNSRRLVATAAGHHAQTFGPLVVIDPAAVDDDEVGPLKRLTPEVGHPEADIPQNKGQRYASPWPLSEEFYLVAHDPQGETGHGTANNYGLYVLDAFGNRVLLYRDPAISCSTPIPLRPRPVPPVLPHRTSVGFPPREEAGLPAAAAAAQNTHARVGLINVYDSLLPLPEGVKITHLRIIRVLPKTTPGNNTPTIGYAFSEKNARAVLGTVPVEEDGSAYFLMPVNMPVLYQALDANGCAVQSMRSNAYVHPGEELYCRGCHEPKNTAPLKAAAAPLAMKRAPSPITPEAAEGANPFSFPRLVQPVLDRNCVACHVEHPGKAPDLRAGTLEENLKGQNPDRDGYWFRSYRNLQPHAFFYGDAGWTAPRTVPGKFGALASKLYPMLRKGHHDVRLSDADMRRIILWLDCNSDFFGAYHDLEQQARGEVVLPVLQ